MSISNLLEPNHFVIDAAGLLFNGDNQTALTNFHSLTTSVAVSYVTVSTGVKTLIKNVTCQFQSIGKLKYIYFDPTSFTIPTGNINVYLSIALPSASGFGTTVVGGTGVAVIIYNSLESFAPVFYENDNTINIFSGFTSNTEAYFNQSVGGSSVNFPQGLLLTYI